MRRTRRPIALVLLVMAVVCSPAGVCMIDGMAATVQTAASTHAHACGQSAEGTFLAARDGSCCTEPGPAVVHVFRFTLHKQALPAVLDIGEAWTPKTLATDRIAFDRRAPLVLRI